MAAEMWWLLILIGMSFFVGQMAGGVIFLLWIVPLLDKRAKKSDRSDQSDGSDLSDGSDKNGKAR